MTTTFIPSLENVVTIAAQVLPTREDRDALAESFANETASQARTLMIQIMEQQIVKDAVLVPDAHEFNLNRHRLVGAITLLAEMSRVAKVFAEGGDPWPQFTKPAESTGVMAGEL